MPADEPTAADVPGEDLLIEFAKVTLRRGGKTLVGPIDWAVELDERWVVIGPNALASQPLFDEALRCCLAGRNGDALNGAITLHRAGLRDPVLNQLFERLGYRPPG